SAPAGLSHPGEYRHYPAGAGRLRHRRGRPRNSTLMVLGFIGGMYQRLLAYHTLENIGIILLGLGAFVTGVADPATAR
ncbi:hypothetical protein C7D72_29770, partial [Klebsiella pneumoniae]